MKFWDWLLGRGQKKADATAGPCKELLEAAADVQLREFALQVCINLIANAVGKCEFKTFVRGSPTKEAEYYLWNVEPNINQNSTAFMHQMIDKLIRENEALVIATRHRDGHEMLVVADSWCISPRYPAKMSTYTQVQVGDLVYQKTFYENEVLHFQLNAQNTQRVLDRLYASYYRLLSAAQDLFTWSNGRHLKVHVDQMESGQNDFAKKFQTFIETQVKPFLQSNAGVLPEFNGYTYTDFGPKDGARDSTRDIRALVEDIFDFTARACSIPPVILTGNVADSKDALSRWLTTGIDPLCDQLQEEIVRKRYGYEEWAQGNYLQIDTAGIQHYDIFADADNVQKLIGSGVYSINDVREAAGLPRIAQPWADEHWLTLNISTMKNAVQSTNGEGEKT